MYKITCEQRKNTTTTASQKCNCRCKKHERRFAFQALFKYSITNIILFVLFLFYLLSLLLFKYALLHNYKSFANVNVACSLDKNCIYIFLIWISLANHFININICIEESWLENFEISSCLCFNLQHLYTGHQVWYFKSKIFLFISLNGVSFLSLLTMFTHTNV